MTNQDSFKLTSEVIAFHYDKLNRKYFGGTLPLVPFRVSRTKSRAGFVRTQVLCRLPNRRMFGKYVVNPKMLNILCLGISDFYSRTLRDFQMILIHEMIHVELMSQGVVYTTGDSSHGLEFMRRLRKLSELTGWNIPVTENRSQSTVCDDVARKTVECMLFRKAQKSYAVTFILGALNDADRSNLKRRFTRRGYLNIRFCISDHLELQKCTHHRKVANALHLNSFSEDFLSLTRS